MASHKRAHKPTETPLSSTSTEMGTISALRMGTRVVLSDGVIGILVDRNGLGQCWVHIHTDYVVEVAESEIRDCGDSILLHRRGDADAGICADCGRDSGHEEWCDTTGERWGADTDEEGL
jgi:hypothetical protein